MSGTQTQQWSIQLPDEPMAILDEITDRIGAALLVCPSDRSLIIRAQYGRAANDAVPWAIYAGRVRRHWLPEDIDVRQVKQYLATNDAQALLERIVAGYSEHWDGQLNLVGVLDLDATLALDLLEEMLDTMRLSDEEDGAGRWNADAWLEGATGQEEDGSYRIGLGGDQVMVITPNTDDDTLYAYAKQIEEDARSYFASVRGVFDYLQNLRLDSQDLRRDIETY